MNPRMTATTRRCIGPEEYPALVDIWRSAVRATHHFLTEEDFQAIESNLSPAYFPAAHLFVAECNNHPVGFAGVVEDSLEMLFVADEFRGQGVGSLLLRYAVDQLGVRKVDVNEQNPGAVGFYLHHGFVQGGRDDLDADGRPYPILHFAIEG
ncbi:MAG: GNAT family N-acetyltransferase [Corynebacterium sp.]|uniref:GNAT family N-acetyltransferase n=1 Tax=Corynebacterium sp. TaxID=1720 RepID=UPI0026DCCDA5|nr:GNAT family N-acetyltransferase [Corynebacterium sp.]MDO5029953.1 GNAT family N-acetyltransferase [Corynebacterium sp.]